MQGARRRPWWLPRASRATPQTPLSLPTLRDRADFPSCGVVASLLGAYPTASAPPCLRGNLPRSRPRGILRQAPGTISEFIVQLQLSLASEDGPRHLESARDAGRGHAGVALGQPDLIGEIGALQSHFEIRTDARHDA